MKKIALLIFILLAVISLSAQTDLQKQLVGKTYRNIQEIPFFKDVQGTHGVSIANTDCSLTDVQKQENHFILLESVVGNPKRPNYKIMSVLFPGNINNNEGIVLRDFMLNNKKIKDVIGVVDLERTKNPKVLKNVKRAWKIDLKNNKFIPIDVKGLSCENPDYGS